MKIAEVRISIDHFNCTSHQNSSRLFLVAVISGRNQRELLQKEPTDMIHKEGIA
jgi:hypothetical protein